MYIYIFIYLFIFSILGPTKYTDEQYASPAFTNWWVQKKPGTLLPRHRPTQDLIRSPLPNIIITLIYIYIYLVGGFNHLEKYQSVGIIVPNIWENKKCSKPPTRYYIMYPMPSQKLTPFHRQADHACEQLALCLCTTDAASVVHRLKQKNG